MLPEIKEILQQMTEKRASDLHITSDSPMHYRIDGDLVEVCPEKLSREQVKKITYSLMNEGQIDRFQKDKELDFSIELGSAGRFRVNLFIQRERIGGAIRWIPSEIPAISELGLPEDIVMSFCRLRKGLVLVTGATGSGKSTTLAAMVDEINRTRRCHIVTVEDPIEFVHKNKRSIVDQRQVLSDTHSFGAALRHVLRQDPDVILVGEMRDLDTIQQAMIIADTGHLVLGTIHTTDSAQTINRIIDVFPPNQQGQIRTQLSFVLSGILSQQLLPKKNEKGRILAAEVLIMTSAVRSVIRDGKEHQIYSTIQMSKKIGMKTMNQSLAELYSADMVSIEEAMSHSSDPDELGKMIN